MPTIDPLDLLGSLVEPNGARWGAQGTDWQRADAAAVLTGDRPNVYLTRPRGGGKTSTLAGIAIAAVVCQLPPRARAYGAASDRDQAALLLDAVAGYIATTPGLADLVTVDAQKVTGPTGATFEVLPADSAGTFGLTPHLVVLDEYAWWPDTPRHRQFYTALVSGLPKVPGARQVVITTAGDPASPAAKLLDRARTSPAWYVHEQAGPLPWVAPDALAEQRASLTDWDYRRLHLNQWTAPADRLTTAEGLAACITLDGPQPPRAGHRYHVGLDVGLTNDRTVAAVCHLDGETVVLDRMHAWQGTRLHKVDLGDVEAWLASASREYLRAPVTFDPYQAVHLGQRLKAQGVRTHEYAFTSSSVSRLATTLHRLVAGGNLALPDDPDLIAELERVKLVETSPGTYRLDHKRGDHDDRAIALALAAHALTDTPQRGTMRYRPLRRPDAHPFVESPQPIHTSPPPAEHEPTRCPCGGDQRTWRRNALGSWGLAGGSHHHIDPGRAPHSTDCRCSSLRCEGSADTLRQLSRPTDPRIQRLS